MANRRMLLAAAILLMLLPATAVLAQGPPRGEGPGPGPRWRGREAPGPAEGAPTERVARVEVVEATSENAGEPADDDGYPSFLTDRQVELAEGCPTAPSADPNAPAPGFRFTLRDARPLTRGPRRAARADGMRGPAEWDGQAGWPELGPEATARIEAIHDQIQALHQELAQVLAEAGAPTRPGAPGFGPPTGDQLQPRGGPRARGGAVRMGPQGFGGPPFAAEQRRPDDQAAPAPGAGFQGRGRGFGPGSQNMQPPWMGAQPGAGFGMGPRRQAGPGPQGPWMGERPATGFGPHPQWGRRPWMQGPVMGAQPQQGPGANPFGGPRTPGLYVEPGSPGFGPQAGPDGQPMQAPGMVPQAGAPGARLGWQGFGGGRGPAGGAIRGFRGGAGPGPGPMAATPADARAALAANPELRERVVGMAGELRELVAQLREARQAGLDDAELRERLTQLRDELQATLTQAAPPGAEQAPPAEAPQAAGGPGRGRGPGRGPRP